VATHPLDAERLERSAEGRGESRPFLVTGMALLAVVVFRFDTGGGADERIMHILGVLTALLPARTAPRCCWPTLGYSADGGLPTDDLFVVVYGPGHARGTPGGITRWG